MDIKIRSPKIIALLPFRNEEVFLKEYIHTVKKITDHIVAHDNGSTDNGTQMLKEAGAIIIPRSIEFKEDFREHEIRTLLLEHGRIHGGTHFICLDADEVFSDNFHAHARDTILALSPGQSLWMDWVTLFRDASTERIDGIYKKISKSFIFCDDVGMQFKYAFLGVSRTPGDVLNRVVIERSKGSVIHYQYVNTERSDMKRMWYMCYEHIRKVRSPLRINATYDIQKNKTNTPTRSLSLETKFTIINPAVTTYDRENDWRFIAIKNWFDTYGVEFFEPLDIWEDGHLRKLFKERAGRNPQPVVLPSWLLKLNDIKNKIRIYISFIHK